MRSSLSVAVLALLQGTNAFMRHTQAQLDMWAIMGLKPGEALEGSSFDNSANPRVSKRASSSVAADVKPKVHAPEHIKLPLDHFSSSKDQKYFNNRYWVNMDEYKPGGPVFIFDPGEEAADSVAKYTLYNETSFFVDILKDFHGIGIVFEHRFYGESTPVPININTTAESFRFLTAEQALKDVVVFANQFSRPDINETLTADQRPWVWVGGSYAAFRGAQMRRLYPDTIFASYSSSAPVEAVYNMDFFWDPIWEGMNAQGYGNCSRDIQAATRHIDEILAKGEPYAQQIKERFFGLGVNSTNANFGAALALVFSQWRSWGIDGGNWGLMLFCEWIEKDHKTNETAPAEGWAATRGAEYAVEQWISYPRLVRSLNEQWEIDCSGSLNKTGDCWLDAPFTDPSVIAWTWQWCTEFGWLAPANLGPQQLLSKYMTLEYQQEWCSITFPNAPADLLPKAAPVDRTNARWGGFSIRPSNTFFTNGRWDPWRTVSLASDRSFAPKGVEITQEIPKCGVSTGKNKVFGTLMPDATHCWDFHTVDNLSVEGPSTRALFKAALREWLPCFQPKKGAAKQWNA